MESHNLPALSFLYQLAEQNDLIVFVYDIDANQFRYLNPAFEQTFDKKREGLSYKDLLPFIYSEDQSYVGEVCRRLIAGDEELTGEANKHIEFRIILPDETIKWLQVKPLLILDEQKKRLFSGTAEDVTLKKYHTDLESKFANKKNAILQILSHDLAGPLGTIQSLSSLISTRVSLYKDEDLLRVIDLITETSRHSIRMIRDFIQQEFLESTEADLVKKRVNLVEVVGQMIDQLQQSQKDMSKTFHFVTSDPSIYAIIDEIKFVQIINNLLSNAIKFTYDDGIITVRLEDNEEKDTILFSVEDNGIGIPEKYHASLFDKFTKARRPGLRKEATVGLGMSIVKTIVEWHHGKIWYESKENQGSTFYVEIPRYGASQK